MRDYAGFVLLLTYIYWLLFHKKTFKRFLIIQIKMTD